MLIVKSMKYVFCIIILVIAVLACGCTASAPAPIAPENKSALATPLPNFVGNWSGPMKGMTEGTGYRELPGGNMTMVVTEQNDRFFSGHFLFLMKNGTMRFEEFAGVISPDYKSFRIIEYVSGHGDGYILSANEIEVIYLDDTDPSSIVIDSLKRQ
jgi:hypothetical protein